MAHAASDDRTITSVLTSPDNTFDNQLVAAGTDSGAYFGLDIAGGAVAAENPDNQGGFRVEFYNAGGNLVRRRISAEVNTDTTGAIQWNGQGDSHVNDTLAYGAYTARAYLSMRNPTISAVIEGSGTTIDRPGDLHVTDAGVLSWTNTGTRLSFCQVSLGDPNVEAATFLRLVDLPSGMGSVGTDKAYGIVMNSANQVFITDNENGGVAGVRIAKYSTATETWITYNWATAASTSIDDDEWVGLGIDDKDSIYVACLTNRVLGGNAGVFEGVVRFNDSGTAGGQHTASNDVGQDIYDVSPLTTNDSVFLLNFSQGRVRQQLKGTLQNSVNSWVDYGASSAGSIFVTTDTAGAVYVCDANNDRFIKYRSNNGTANEVYRVSSPNGGSLESAKGITVWRKAATGETFVIVASGSVNQIGIYKENAAGDSAVFVRLIQDDPYNLLSPEGIAIDADSAIFVVSRGQRSVKKFSVDGIFQALPNAANGQYIQGNDNTVGLTDSSGFNQPTAIAVDDTGDIYVFDQNNATNPTHIALKKFSSSGAPLGVIRDLDASFANGVFNQSIISATWGAGALYAVSLEDGGRVLRMNSIGDILGHLGGSNAGPEGGPYTDAPEGNANQDVLAMAIAPYFDRANNRFFPQALYFHNTIDEMEVWRTDFSIGALATGINPPQATNTNPTAVPQTYLVDEFGEVYLMNDGVSGGNYRFRRWNGATVEDQFGTNELLSATFAQGSGVNDFDAPRQAVWTDNKGAYVNNPITGRYERKIWVNDSANNRLQQILLAWNDVEDKAVTIALSQDTPLVISASISSETIATVAGTFYVGVSICTVQINFNKSMVTTPNPDTITVQIKPSGGAFIDVNQISYSNATWTGTAAITAGLADGEVIIKVENAYDNSGTVRFMDPNPDQTDFDVGDDFKPFIIDKTAPVVSITAPAETGDTTSGATYTVSGTITNEATGLDCSIEISVWTAISGGTQTNVTTTTSSAVDGSFSANVTLRTPAPTENFIEVIAVDKVGNRFALTPLRRLVSRVKNVGNANILPSGETVVGSPRRYTITYTAAQDLTGDSLKFIIPNAWSAPQKTSATTAGYVTMNDAVGAYTDSNFDGRVVTLLGVVRGIGQTIKVVYGDSSTSGGGGNQTALAKSTLDAPLDNASNTFGVELQQAGETTFTTVSATSGLTLTVPLRDSAASLAIIETGPRGNAVLTDSITISKGTETKVMSLRWYNTNIGAHANRVTQIQFMVESDTGASVNWSNTVSRVIVKNTDEGNTFADVTTFPASQTLVISPSGFTIDQGSTRDMEFWVTFSASATPDTVRFVLASIGGLAAVDSATGKAISIFEQETKAIGLRTGEYDIIGREPADTLYVGADTGTITPTDVSTRQSDRRVMDFSFRNDTPHVDTPVNSIRIDKLIFTVRDSYGAGIIPARVLKGIAVEDALTSVSYGGLDTPSIPNGTGLDTISLSLSGLTVASGATVNIRVLVDIVNDTVGPDSFRIMLDSPATAAQDSRVIAKDQVTQFNVKILDDPGDPDDFKFQTNGIRIIRRGRINIARWTLLQTDSTIIPGTLVAGSQFFVAINCTTSATQGAVRVIPDDTDLRFTIQGANATGQFTVDALTAAKTISAGSEDTIFYGVVQNLGDTTGLLVIQFSDTGGAGSTVADTRPRFFDDHDYTGADAIRAEYLNDTLTTSVTLTGQALVATVFTLDTTYANAGETAVPILHFSVKNNQGSARRLDSIVLEAISPDSAIKRVRLYHDGKKTDTGILKRSDSPYAVAGFDTLVSSDTLMISDSSVILRCSVTIGAGRTESFFVAFDFDDIVFDGDTFDARIPASGLRSAQELFYPSSLLNSSGDGRLEVVATRITVTPDTQIVAVSSSPNITLKAVDAFGNLDNIINYETTTQGRNIQLTVTVSDAIPATDTNFSITATSGMTSVTPTPAATGISSINGNLSAGQGQVTLRDTSAETIAITIASTLVDSSAAIQYANLISVQVVNLAASDSASPDSKAFQVVKFRVVNQSGQNDQVTQVGIRSLNTNDAHISAVVLFQDANGNEAIDSGTDVTLATGTFTSGFVTFSFLTADVLDQDSELFMVGYDVATTVTDAALLDAQVDTVVINSSGANIASQLNSTPNRRTDVKVVKLSMSPQSATNGTGVGVTVTVKAVDTYANTDIHYNGGTGITWDLTGSGFYQTATLAVGYSIGPAGGLPDNSQIKGNLVAGEATLTFTDNIAETTVMSVVTSPGLVATHDTGAFTFQQGYLATALNADQKSVNPGDTNVVLLAFNISAAGTSDSPASFSFTWVSSADTRQIRNLRLFTDLDNVGGSTSDDTFTLAGDTRYAEAVSFVGSTCTFVALYSNDTKYIASGGNRSFYLIADIADTAIGGDTLDMQLEQASITTHSKIPNVPLSIRNSPQNCTVARVPDAFRVGRVSTADRQASEDQTEIIPMTLRFSSPGVADRKFFVETFAIMVEGLSGGVAPNTRIARAQLRNQGSGIVYIDKVGIESTGDSLIFAIRYDSANPLSVGGATPETITVDVVLTIAASVTHNDTFRLRVNALDTTWMTVWDHKNNTLAVRDQKGNVAVLSPSSLPLLGSVVTVQKKAIVTQQAVRITDLSGNDIQYPTSIIQGEQFKVEVGLRATSGRANAQVKSADTDLRFFRNNGATEITSEFAIVSRTHSALTTITAGTVDTVTYTVAQGAPFSGANETLVINNYLLSDTGPYLQDFNSNADAVKLRIYAVEDAVSTDAVRIDSAYVGVSALSLAANDIGTESKGTRILGIKMTDGGPANTLTGVRVHLLTSAAASMIKSCWIAIDTNANQAYDSGVDPYFGNVQDFKSSDTVYFIGSIALSGVGTESQLYMLINLETSPVTDSTQIKAEIVVDGLGFAGQDSIPKTPITNSALFRTIIVGTRFQGAPDSQTVAVGAGATITLTVEDTYGNRNIRTTNFAAVTTNCRIIDTWGPIAAGTAYDSKSARWTATTLTSQSPAVLPSAADNYDTLVTGKPTAGIGTVSLTDTATETVVVVFSAAGLADKRCTVAFNADPNVTAVALTALGAITPDSTNAVILQIDVAYPFTLTTVDSIHLVSENTFDTAVKLLRLWVDSNQNGIFSTATDSNIDTAAWSGGRCSFLVNRNWIKPAAINSQRLFVTIQMETSPQNDNDSIGARIDTAGIRMTPGGNFPPTGELDSILTDTQNAVISVDATRTGGKIRIVDPGQQNKDVPFTLTLRAEDAHGNHDRIFTTLGSSGAKDISFSASPAGFTFNSTSMTLTTAVPATTMTARFKAATDTIEINPSLAATITLTADIGTPPPADTTIDIVVVAGGWSVTALSLSDGQFVAGDSGQVVSRVQFKNLDVSADTLTRIDIADLGNLVCNADVTNVALWLDSNANGVFDTGLGPGTDSILASTTFSAVETAAFDITRRMGSNVAESYFIVVAIAAAPAGANGDTINIRYASLTCSTSRFGRIPLADVTHSDSVSFSAPSLGDLFAFARSVPDANVTSGADNVLVGSFYVQNTRTNADSVQTIVVKNDTGAHPDTGLRVKIFIDGDSDGVFDGGGVDTPFGTSGIFVNRVFSVSDSARIGANGETVGFLVLFDLSDTLTVDSQYLRVYIDTFGFTAFVTNGTSDSGESVLLRSSGNVKTNLVGSVFLGDSVLVSAGSAAATDTIFVSVAVRDTNGSPLAGRSVTLYAYDATILTTNPVVTDTRGYAQYAITSLTAAVISCTVAIDTGSPPVAKPASTGYANFLSLLAIGDTQFSNNTQHATITGVNRKHLTAPSFDSMNANNIAYGYYENNDYRIYGGTFPTAPAAIVSSAGFPGITITAPAPTWTSNPRVRRIKGVAEPVVLFGGFTTDTHFGTHLYYRELDGGGATTRISPNDTRSGTNNFYFDTDAEFDQFDVSPSGETIVSTYTGQLAWWRAVGSAFNPGADSKTFQFVTTLMDSSGSLTGGYGWNGAYIQYPSWSPDGNRIAFTVVYRNNSFAGPSDTAEIFVLYNLGGITTAPIPFQRFGNVTGLPVTTNPYLVRITRADSIPFAWQPQWSRDGSVLFFSGNNNLNFNYEVFNQTENPHNAIGATGVDFNTYMIYYDKTSETVPYAAIRVSAEPSVDEIVGEMSANGESLAIMRAPSPNYEEVRTVRVASQANVTANGGILFDSGRVSVVIRENDAFGGGFTIAVASPSDSPSPNNDSIIISGLAKRFFNPDTPTAPVYFPESVSIFLYYKAGHFEDSDLIGYDADGDGIPDRTENAISAYYWNGTNWVAYQTVRFPAENKIQFWTNHFSEYAAGIPMEARAMAFGGSVSDVIAYPNPWRADGATAGLASTDERYGIKLTRMPGPDVRVRIFTINGDLVNDATVNAANGTSTNPALRVTAAIVNDGTVGGTLSWNLRNRSNREVASGVYLIVLEGPGGKAVRKVAVIR